MRFGRYMAAAALALLPFATAAQETRDYYAELAAHKHALGVLYEGTEKLVLSYWQKFNELETDIKKIKSKWFVVMPKQDSRTIGLVSDYISRNPATGCTHLLREMYTTGREIRLRWNAQIDDTEAGSRIAMYMHAEQKGKEVIDCMAHEEKRVDDLRGDVAWIKNRV